MIDTLLGGWSRGFAGDLEVLVTPCSLACLAMRVGADVCVWYGDVVCAQWVRRCEGRERKQERGGASLCMSLCEAAPEVCGSVRSVKRDLFTKRKRPVEISVPEVCGKYAAVAKEAYCVAKEAYCVAKETH